MNPKQTDERRKLGPCSIMASVALGLVIVFELVYLVVGSLPGNGIFSRFSPNLSDEDVAMIQANIPGHKTEPKAVKPKKPEPEPATAVDAALSKKAEEDRASAITTDAEGTPSAIVGANDVQWTVVDTNELKALARAMTATNAAVSTNNIPSSPEAEKEAPADVAPEPGESGPVG